MPQPVNRARLRTALLRQRQALIHQFLDVEESLHELEGSREIETMDQVQAEVAEELLSRLDEEDRRGLNEIEAALARIDAGTYGTCESCGRSIGFDRLTAEPTARLCVACASAAEARPTGG